MKFLAAKWKSVVWFLITFYLFFFKVPGPDIDTFIPIDKLAHLGIFFICVTILHFDTRNANLSTGTKIALPLIISVAYGGLVEIIQQLFIPYRSGDILDFLFDVFGVAAAGLFFFIFNMKKSSAT